MFCWKFDQREITKFCSAATKEWLEGPLWTDINGNQWYLIVYPRGYSNNEDSNRFTEVFVMCTVIHASALTKNKSDIHPNGSSSTQSQSQGIQISINVECAFFNTTWNEMVDFDCAAHKTNCFAHRLKACVPAAVQSAQQSVAAIEDITFKADIRVIVKHDNDDEDAKQCDLDQTPQASSAAAAHEQFPIHEKTRLPPPSSSSILSLHQHQHRPHCQRRVRYKWIFAPQLMSRFLGTTMGKPVRSPLFEIAGNLFECLLFPNGPSSFYRNSVPLFIRLVERNPNMNAIVIVYDVQCVELNVQTAGCMCFGDPSSCGKSSSSSSNTSTPYAAYSVGEDFQPPPPSLPPDADGDNSDGGAFSMTNYTVTSRPFGHSDSLSAWGKFFVQSDQLRALSSFTLVFDFHVLRLSFVRRVPSSSTSASSSSSASAAGYRFGAHSLGWMDMEFTPPWTLSPQLRYEWHVPRSCYENAMKEKSISSPRFQCWKLLFYPNGFGRQDIGRALLYLQLIAVWEPVRCLQVNVTVRCAEIAFRFSAEHVEFRIGQSRLLLRGLQDIEPTVLQQTQQLSFEVEIEIVKLYDCNRCKVQLAHDDEDEDNQTLRQYIEKLQHEMNELKKTCRALHLGCFSVPDLEIETANNDSNQLNKAIDVVKHWMQNVVQLDYYDMFIDDGWDTLQCIKTMTENDLLRIGVGKRGHRVRLLQHILQLP